MPDQISAIIRGILLPVSGVNNAKFNNGVGQRMRSS